MSETFTKLFASITDSTIWAENNETRIVWITLLAMADQTGYVGASLPGLAYRARVPIDATEAAVAKLSSPDPHSRTPDCEGRRIEAVERGWHIINYEKHRNMRDDEVRRAYERGRKQRQRARLRQQSVRDSPVIVRDSHALSQSVPQCLPASAQAEAEAEAEAEADQEDLGASTIQSIPKTQIKSRIIKTTAHAPRSLPVPDGFAQFWSAYPKRIGKGKALKAWIKHSPPLEAVLAVLAWQSQQHGWREQGGRFIPHPTTWLNRHGWEDEPQSSPAADWHTDWHVECEQLHGGTCPSRYQHALKLGA